jgi:hypothetical protein
MKPFEFAQDLMHQINEKNKAEVLKTRIAKNEYMISTLELEIQRLQAKIKKQEKNFNIFLLTIVFLFSLVLIVISLFL